MPWITPGWQKNFDCKAWPLRNLPIAFLKTEITSSIDGDPWQGVFTDFKPITLKGKYQLGHHWNHL